MLAPFPGGSGMLRPAGMIRERSSWPSRTLSYSGRKRGGAGVSASGRGASGRSKSSRPCSSWKVSSRGRSRSTTSRRRVRPDHAWTSITDRRAEGRRDSGRPARRSTDAPPAAGRARPPASSAPPARCGPTARAAGHGRAAPGSRPRRSGNLVGTSGQRSPSRRASSGPVRGRTSTSSRPAARTSLEVGPGDRPPERAGRESHVRAPAGSSGRKRQRVIGGDQVDRRPHQGGPDRAPILDRLGQLARPEVAETRPERDVRRQRSLRLEPDEVCDRRLGGHRLPLEQELAGEQGPVERALAEHRAQR